MQPIARVVGIAVAVVVMGCQTTNASAVGASGGVTDAERAVITDTVTAIVNSVMSGAAHLKGAEVAARFAKDSVMITDNGVESTSADAMAAQADSLYAILSSVNGKTTAINVKVLSPEAAFVHVSLKFDLTTKAGRSVNANGVVTALVQRRSGTWAITDFHESEADIATVMAALTPPAPGKK
jgi:uncharacterized protein (TIGR02246 family)